MSESCAPGVEVDHERSEDERHRHENPLPGFELPPAGEVRGEKRQHEQTEVPHEPGRRVIEASGGQARNLDDDGCGDGEGERLDQAAGRGAPARRHL